MKLQQNNSHMVRVYDHALPEDLCYNLIDLFKDSNHTEFINEDHKPCFTQLNINQHNPELVRHLVGFVKKVYDQYSDLNSFMPKLKYLEEFRIKEYDTSGEQRFDTHVDITDFPSCSRAVAFLFYLNDNDGKTVFRRQDVSVKPETGKCVVFPPTWEYPHKGVAPKSEFKYILSTYVRYN